MTVSETLTELGYILKDFGAEFRTKPIYRESNNSTSLAIDKSTGDWRDYSAQISGTFPELIKLSLGLSSLDDAQKWISGKSVEIAPRLQHSPLKTQKIFSPDILNGLVKDNTYWSGRGISADTMLLFKGGVINAGRMNGRYIFPIYNSKKEIIGVSGRDVTGKSAIRWKHLGPRNEFVWPAFLNREAIKAASEVILVESPGCILKLWDCSVKNAICLFGIDLSLSVLNFILRLDLSRIIVATNNEPDNNNVGNLAAAKIEKKLLKYFDRRQVMVRLPFKKDFGEMSKEEIVQWKSGQPVKAASTITTRINVKTGAAYDVYMGRANPTYELEESPFANPFIIGRDGDRNEVCDLYEPYLDAKLIAEPKLAAELASLKGKVLACWCGEERCHVDYIIKLINALPKTDL